MRIGGRIESMKEFQTAYFSAGTPLKRVGIVVGAAVPTFMTLGFSIVWSWISVGFLFSVLTGNAEGGPVWFPVLFVGVFVAVGIGLFSFAVYRLISLIRIVAKAPRAGSVPEILSGTGTPSENAAGDNPFSANLGEDETPRKSPKKPSTLKERVVPAIFGLVFFAVGILLFGFGVKNYFEEEKAAGTWVSAPCKIVSAKIESSRGSKGGTTYSPKIVYEFSVGGKIRCGDDIFMSMNSSSSDYDKEKQRLQKYKKASICWYNPENPEESALMRPEGGLSLKKLILPLFGLPFIIVGGVVFVGFAFCGFFKKREAAKRAAKPLGVLELCGSPKSEAAGAVLFAALWNLLVFIVGAGFCSDGMPSLFVVVFLSVFALVGIIAAFIAIRNVLRIFNPRYEVSLFPAGTLRPNDFARLEWRVAGGNPAKSASLKAELVRLEKTGWVVNGAPKEKATETVPVFETMSRTEIVSGMCEFRVPENINSGKWVLRISGETTFLRPRLKYDFRLP